MEENARRAGSGLIFGKFLPPHRGHVFLIEHALSRVERLTVAVCSLSREPIPGELRFRWMQELAPGARVVHVTDDNPQHPHEHARFWEIWRDTLLHAAGRPDVLFTSETYGDDMARWLGARHALVDRERNHVPVSASAIRANPLGFWAFISEPVRPYYVRRVVLTGSESTGKTMLAAELAAHYATVSVGEYGRAYMNQKRAPFEASDVEPIARGQIAAEDAAARRANKLLVLDTDLMSTVAYARHYYGACPPWVEEAARARAGHLYLLHHPDVPWVPDPGQRDRPQHRGEMHVLFRETLDSFGVSVVDIVGSWAERKNRAIAAIDGLLSRPL
jgi:NadR type nicotinamide-nucleotide adenylyltransferase